MEQYINFVLSGLAAGVIALTLTRGSIFKSMRYNIQNSSEFFGDLVICPYCMSHWVAAVMMLVFHPHLTNSGYNVAGFPVVDYLVTYFAMVGVATFSAGAIKRLIME